MRQGVVLHFNGWMCRVVLVSVDLGESVDGLLHTLACLGRARVSWMVLEQVRECPHELPWPDWQGLFFMATTKADVDHTIVEGHIRHDVACVRYLQRCDISPAPLSWNIVGGQVEQVLVNAHERYKPLLNEGEVPELRWHWRSCRQGADGVPLQTFAAHRALLVLQHSLAMLCRCQYSTQPADFGKTTSGPMPCPSPADASELRILHLNWVGRAHMRCGSLCLQRPHGSPRQWLRQTPRAFSGSSSILSGTSSILSGTSSILSGTSSILSGTASILSGTSSIRHGTSSVGSCPASILSGTASILSGTSSILSGTSSILSGTASILSSTASILSGTSSILSGTSSIRHGTSSVGPCPASILSGASSILSGASSICFGSCDTKQGYDEWALRRLSQYCLVMITPSAHGQTCCESQCKHCRDMNMQRTHGHACHVGILLLAQLRCSATLIWKKPFAAKLTAVSNREQLPAGSTARSVCCSLLRGRQSKCGLVSHPLLACFFYSISAQLNAGLRAATIRCSSWSVVGAEGLGRSALLRASESSADARHLSNFTSQ